MKMIFLSWNYMRTILWPHGEAFRIFFFL